MHKALKFPRKFESDVFLLNLWNRGAFGKIVKDTYNSAMGYLGKARGIQTMEERHQTFLNLVLKGKLRKA